HLACELPKLGARALFAPDQAQQNVVRAIVANRSKGPEQRVEPLFRLVGGDAQDERSSCEAWVDSRGGIARPHQTVDVEPVVDHRESAAYRRLERRRRIGERGRATDERIRL